MIKLHRIFAICLLVLGLVHISFTPVFFPHWNLSALWFTGSGLPMILLGLFNLILPGSSQRGTWLLTLTANLLVLLFCIATVTLLRAPQAWIGFVLVAGQIVTTLSLRPRK